MRTRISTAGSERPGHATGFTLLELVVVLVIMGIVFGMTIPRFSGMLGGGSTVRFSKQLAAYLRNARELALVRNAPVRVDVDSGSRRIALSAPGEVLDPLEVPAEVEIEVELEGSDPERGLVFYPLGNATPGRIILRGGEDDPIGVGIERMTGDVFIE